MGCWPGNFALRLLSGTEAGKFLEISYFDQYTTGAWILSVIVWDRCACDAWARDVSRECGWREGW